MQTSPPVDNTHNSGKSEIKTSHPVDNTYNSTKPDVEMQDRRFVFHVLIQCSFALSCFDTVH